MELRRQGAVLRANLWLIVVGTLIAALIALVGSGFLPRVYEAQATLLVGQSLTVVNPDYNQLLASQRLSQTYAEVATTRPILERVISDVRLPTTSDELVKRIWVDVPRDSTLIRIRTQDGDANRAAAIANAVATELVAGSPGLQGRQAELLGYIEADLEATRKDIVSAEARLTVLSGLDSPTPAQVQQIEALQARLITLRSTHAALLAFSSGTSVNLLSVVEPAIAPGEPASPRPLINAALAAVLALLVLVAVSFIRDYLDDTVKGSEDLEELVGLPVLGQVARFEGTPEHSEIYRVVTLVYPRSAAAESFRVLRTNVEFASVDAPFHTLLIASALPEEGKTTLASNLAVVFAQAGRRVLLVDADLRKPAIHRMFGLRNQEGLTTLLRSEEIEPASVIWETEQPLLRVLTSGPLPPSPAEMLQSGRMRLVLERLAREADILIFDSPPLQAVTDAAILAAKLDRTLLVVESGRTRRAAARRGREALARVGARVIGTVVNRQPGIGEEGSPYYAYYGEVTSPRAPDGDAAPSGGVPPASPKQPTRRRRMARPAAE